MLQEKIRTTSKFSVRVRGLSLTERMVTAVLAAIALPSYASYVVQPMRADAKGQLIQAAQFMQPMTVSRMIALATT